MMDMPLLISDRSARGPHPRRAEISPDVEGVSYLPAMRMRAPGPRKVLHGLGVSLPTGRHLA